MIYNRKTLLLFPIIVLLAIPKPAAGPLKPGDPVGFRTYLAVNWVQQPLSDAFDGYSFYSDGINLYTIPSLESGTGVRVALGFRRRDLAFEVSYTTTSHRTEWLGIPNKARHHEIGPGIKYYLNPDGIIQPYGYLGLLLHFLVAQEGGLDLESELPVRETFEGMGIRFSTGVRLKLGGPWAVRGDISYRLANFRTLSGRDFNSLSANSWIPSAGIVHTFGR